MMASHVEVSVSRTLNGPPDEVLIQRFVEGFLQNQTILLSNQQLRTEPLFDSMQLLSSREGVLATAKVKATPIHVIVRQTSSYWELLHQTLSAQSFYPLMRAAQDGCYVYRFVEPPENYTLYCTTAKDLWRACWGRGFGVRSGIPLDLLIWRQGPAGSKETWYSLRGMDCEQGQLIIKMLGWTNTVDSAELLVWAKQDASARKDLRASTTSGLRSNVPFRQ
jgi:hypothetical protein